MADPAVRSVPVSPTGLAPPAARYAHARLTEGATRWLHTSGVVAVHPDGTVPDDIGEQADLIWQIIGTLLAEVGMTTADIVSMTTYAVVGADLAAVMAARDRAMAGSLAASTLLPVPALAQPAWKVEIAVVAAA
jgi:enamine deaminase RidA (YjgF/YER057c/UK114 family)